MEIEHRDKIRSLGEASRLLCEELGEWWQKLVDLDGSCRDCCSDEFREAYIAEVSREYERLKAEYRLVQREPPPRRPHMMLVHVDELDDE